MNRIIFGLALLVILPSLSMVAGAYVTPCAEEDSTNCLWDAGVQGNGHGTSSLRLLLWEGKEMVMYFGGPNG
jgi:hypothetical protein